MADILIRGMGMPPKGKSICIEIFGAGGVHKFGECYPCALAYEVKTPHRRLIDADALLSVLDILKDKGCDGPVWDQMRDIVENMVTIVPAEGGKDDVERG